MKGCLRATPHACPPLFLPPPRDAGTTNNLKLWWDVQAEPAGEKETAATASTGTPNKTKKVAKTKEKAKPAAKGKAAPKGKGKAKAAPKKAAKPSSKVTRAKQLQEEFEKVKYVVPVAYHPIGIEEFDPHKVGSFIAMDEAGKVKVGVWLHKRCFYVYKRLFLPEGFNGDVSKLGALQITFGNCIQTAWDYAYEAAGGIIPDED